MANVTYYVALPFMRDESGEMVAGNAEECQSATTALRRSVAFVFHAVAIA